MTHTKKITDERGTVNIEVRLIAKSMADTFRYEVTAYYTNNEGETIFDNSIADELEIQQAKTELWLKLKP